MRIQDIRELLGLIVAFAGFLMVAFAHEYTIPVLDAVANSFWVNGAFGLTLIIAGTLIVAIKR